MQFTMGSILSSLIFSMIGVFYVKYGKSNGNMVFLISGMILLFYSYFVPNVILSIILGIILVICPFAVNKYL